MPAAEGRCKLFRMMRVAPGHVRGLLVGACLVGGALALASHVESGEPREQLTRAIETDPVRAATSAEGRGGEVLRLQWKLAGFLGVIAGLFVPNEGDALLTFVPDDAGRTEIEILVTAPKREGEYFLYGAAIDESTGATRQVWDSYAFRDSRKDREQEIEEAAVIDYASAIYHLRWHPPTDVVRMTIWNHGRTYPVEVRPLEAETRKVRGKKLEVRGYVIQGVELDGKTSFDDKYFVYFARDEHSTPVEIAGKRGLVRVRIQLVDATGLPARHPANTGIDRAAVPASVH